MLGTSALVDAVSYVQPLALSAATRKQVSKSLLHDIRDEVATVSGEQPVALERLVRVRPRTVITIAALVGAFYVLLQKAGVPTAEAVAGVGLNSLAGAIVHVVLLVVFFAWAGQGGGTGFSIPGGSKVLVIIAVVLAVVGVIIATRRGRHLMRTHVLGFLKQAWTSVLSLARSPIKIAALVGGSVGVTLAYVGALAAAVAAVHGNLTIAEVGAVYLGASIIAAAAPTPGGLGAMEAAVVAGLTGVGMETGPAVAAVLGFRLMTYWIPILPGWIAFHLLERQDLI